MKQKIVNKVYFVSVIRNNKVIEILTGKIIEDLMYKAQTKYKGCATQIMEYNDEFNIYVPDIEEHLLMIRRQHANHIYK